jgi:hypothetical protein
VVVADASVTIVVMVAGREGVHRVVVQGGSGSSCQTDRKVAEVVMEA